MSNILDTVQISGSSYDLKDKNAAGVSGVTQAEYDALVSGGTVDPNMFYVITDAEPQDMSNYWTSAQTESAITDAISGKVDTSAVTSSVTSASTDSQIPTAKAVYDAIPTGGTSITVDQTIDRTSENPISNKAISSKATDGNGYVELTGGRYGWSFYSVAGNGTNRTIWLDKINGEPVLRKYDNTRDLNLVETSAITSSVTSASTDSQIPTAKAVYDALGEGVTVSSAITSGDTNAVAGGAVYDRLDEIEQVIARALNQLAEANEVVARALNDLNNRITALENQLNNS